MFIHKSIYNRNYNYSHPLAGKVYDNKPFADHFSSFLQDSIKLSTAASQEYHRHQNNTAQGKKSQQENSFTRRETARRQTYSANHQSFSNQKLGEQFSRQSISSKNRTPNALSLPISRPQFKLKSKSNDDSSSKKATPRDRKRLKRKMAINHFVDSYLFPSIQLHIINKIGSVGQIPKNSFNFNFEKIFKKLISTQLMGEFTSNFMLKMENYIKKIVDETDQHQERQNIVLQQSFKSISRKNDLLDIIAQLQINGDDQKVEKLVKYYCIPGELQSQTILQGLMNQIVIDLYQKKNCRKDIEYCLLTQQGQIISHISEISFTTRVLLIAPFNNHEVCYSKYKKILEDHDKEQRMTFKQSIKHNFINKIVHNKVQNKLVNYHNNPKQNNQNRRQSQEQAEALLISKSKLRLQKNKKMEGMNVVEPQFDIFSPQFSCQSTYNSFVQRKFRQKREYKGMVLKLRKILDPNNKYIVKSRIDKQTEQQFNQLHIKNDKYDMTFRYAPDNSNKLIFQNVIDNCSVFKNMRKPQMQLILDAVKNYYGKGKLMEQLQFWQFKQILQTAHGVADKSIIMNFVLHYLPFDQWGEVSQKNMFALISEIAPFQGRTLQMLKRILWNWFQVSKLVENNALRKRNMQIWYQPNRVAYLLLLSIIFGSEYKSMAEMIEGLIKYQFY